MRTRVKICGITRVCDATDAVEAGADALGFVFAESPRRVTREAARAIVRALPPFVTKVGVFRNSPLDEVRAIVARVGLDAVQLHGDESAAYCAALDRPVIRRVPMGQSDLPIALREHMQVTGISAWLLDPGAGDGRTFDWTRALGLSGTLIVAGGLTPENVGQAVRLLRPYGVDVSSGVESTPGSKDPERIRSFTEAVRREDARIHAR